MSQDKSPKKKPGRPKKKVPTVNIAINRIVDTPINQDDIVELVYCNPAMFKKILQLYKASNSNELEFFYDKRGISIMGQSHDKKSTIYAHINGLAMNMYYCKTPVRVCVMRDSLDKVLGDLGKNHYKISFLLKENYKSTMYIRINDNEYDSFDDYEIEVTHIQEERAAPAHNDADYPIKFKISSKHFKNQINKIERMSPLLTIQKDGLEPLQLTVDKGRSVKNWSRVYSESSKIELISTISQNDTFSISAYVASIKPFSNTAIGDDVFVAADKVKNISFTTLLDKVNTEYAAEVKLFVEICDFVNKY
jgi:hypothetical protein